MSDFSSLPPGAETAIGSDIGVVAVELKNGRHFDQIAASEGCIIIEVRGYKEIPFA